VKGHPLAWNYFDPPWLPADSAEAMRLQMQRIADIVGRFKGQIDFFDVVNEATRFAREETLQHAPKLTAGIEQMGVPSYLRTAFLRAREANPQATRVINDYVTTDEYREKVISQFSHPAVRRSPGGTSPIRERGSKPPPDWCAPT
jgi:GH35 family endo-1,4-beta-xylanase